jgi:aminoglycoside N3'-acetyltransferase
MKFEVLLLYLKSLSLTKFYYIKLDIDIMIDMNLKNFHPPFFIHSDIVRSHKILMENKKIDKKADVCSLHYNLLKENFGDENLIFPSFNYNFGKNLLFNHLKDEVQVGSLPEWIRLNTSFQRSFTPFFSILSKNKFVEFENIQFPYGLNSSFSKMFKLKGTFLFYGVDFSVFTAIHFLETEFGPPIYRYDKSFDGKIIGKNINQKCTVKFHVRPKDINLQYDWSKMQSDMIKQGVLNKSKKFNYLYFCKSDEIYNFFKKKLSLDPFYMLDSKSAKLFFKLTEKGKKRVELKNFE